MASNARPDGERWFDVPRDPAPEDLGYEPADWEVVTARNDGTGHFMFLPGNEERLREEAFIVADDRSVCDLDDRY